MVYLYGDILIQGLEKVMRLIFLSLVATGMLWGNVVFFTFWRFPVTLTVGFTFILFTLGIIDWLKERRITNTLLKPALVLFLYEIIIHGVLGGGFLDQQWPRSFALFAMCTGLIIISIKFQINKQQLPGFAECISWLAYIIGGLGIIQFILANGLGYIFQPLPEIIALGQVNVESDADRFLGLSRAVGISSEPSYYGMAMVVLTTLCMVLLYLIPPDHRSRFFRNGALLVSVGGVAASASFAAWAILIIVLIGFVLCKPNSSMKQRKAFYLIIIVIICAGIITWPFLQGRFESVFTNPDDHSVNYRLRVAIHLILSPSGDLLSNLLSTGVGMGGNKSHVADIFSKYFSSDYLSWVMGDRPDLVIVSGWAYVAVTMGWVGLALNVWLLSAVFRQRHGWPFPSFPLILLCVGYMFAIGSYLSPEWWALLVLSASLINVQKEILITSHARGWAKRRMKINKVSAISTPLLDDLQEVSSFGVGRTLSRYS